MLPCWNKRAVILDGNKLVLMSYWSRHVVKLRRNKCLVGGAFVETCDGDLGTCRDVRWHQRQRRERWDTGGRDIVQMSEGEGKQRRSPENLPHKVTV